METLKRETYPAAPFDTVVGCSPVVKIGKRVFISGTRSTHVRDIKPVISLVEVKALTRVDRLFEVEADAFIGTCRTSRLTE